MGDPQRVRPEIQPGTLRELAASWLKLEVDTTLPRAEFEESLPELLFWDGSVFRRLGESLDVRIFIPSSYNTTVHWTA